MAQLQAVGEQSWGHSEKKGQSRCHIRLPAGQSPGCTSLLLFIVFLQGGPVPLEEADLGAQGQGQVIEMILRPRAALEEALTTSQP